MNTVLNKSLPNITYNITQDIGSTALIHMLRLVCYTAKFKDGKYRPTVDLYMAYRLDAEHPLEEIKEQGTEALVRKASQDIKRGRYHDWFYAPTGVITPEWTVK